MPTAQLNKDALLPDDGKDSIVIISALTDMPGGRTLDVSGVKSDVIRAGHVLIQNKATKAIAPLGVSGTSYDTLPEGNSYVGVLKCSVLKRDPRAAIVTAGQVNAAASPYPVTEGIKAGLPRIEFIY